MKTTNRILAILALGWVIPAVAAAEDPVGQVQVTTSAAKTPSVTVTGSHGDRSAKSGDSVFAEDRIQTQSGQTAKVLLKDKSSIHLGGASSLAVHSVESGAKPTASVELLSGTAYVKVNPQKTENLRFMLRTKVMTMGVRGTEFVAESKAENLASLHTLEGTVVVAKNADELNQPGAVAVGAGQATDATEQGISKPKTFSLRAYLKALFAENPGLVNDIKESAKERRAAARQAARQKATPDEDELTPKPRRKPIGKKK